MPGSLGRYYWPQQLQLCSLLDNLPCEIPRMSDLPASSTGGVGADVLIARLIQHEMWPAISLVPIDSVADT